MPQQTLSHIEKYFTKLEQLSGGILGIDACHIETNHALKFNSEILFLMCSTYKLPIAIFLLHQVNIILLN